MRFYYCPRTEFGRLFDDALVTRCQPSVSADLDWRYFVLSKARRYPPVMYHCLTYIQQYGHDIHDYKDANTVTATFELPGMKSDDITGTIDVHQNRHLTVAGEERKAHSHEREGMSSMKVSSPSGPR
jgi:HSP20 family protein